MGFQLRKASILFTCLLMTFAAGLHAQTMTIVHDGIDRNYNLYIPASYTGIDPVPLVIGFHGYGTTWNYFEDLSQFSVKSEAEGFIVCYPEATGTPSEWNVGIGFTPETLNIDDIGFVSALIDLLLSQYNIDPDRVYAIGFSNGAIMSYRVASELSEKVTAIGAVAAWGTTAMMENLQISRPVGIMQFHMNDDTSVNFGGGELNGTPYPSLHDYLQNWAEKNGCQSVSRHVEGSEDDGYIGRLWESPTIHGNVFLYRVNFGGHGWPVILVSATDKIWEFFESQVAGSGTAVDESSDAGSLVEDYRLSAFPNPFNGGTEIRFVLDQPSDVLLAVYDARGRLVQTLVDRSMEAGEHARRWDGRDDEGRGVSSGLYFARLHTGSRVVRMKMLYTQ